MQAGGGRSAMNDGGTVLPWLVIRQDDNGNRYRVGRYATKDEAQKIADRLDARGHRQLYSVERIGQTAR
jgi:sporulation related protein